MDGGGDRPERVLYPNNIDIIREIYDSPHSEDIFANQLEKALDTCCKIIVIEPTHLGEETARWITCGNILHKMAVISGFSSIVTGYLWPQSFLPQSSLSIFSVLCTGLYTTAWQFDPCVKYQVERNLRKLAKLPILNEVTAASPVVLVRKDDSRRKILHCTVSITAAAMCIYRLYVSAK